MLSSGPIAENARFFPADTEETVVADAGVGGTDRLEVLPLVLKAAERLLRTGLPAAGWMVMVGVGAGLAPELRPGGPDLKDDGGPVPAAVVEGGPSNPTPPRQVTFPVAPPTG